jgi:hypothetical protein
MTLFVSPGIALSLCVLGLHAAAVPSAQQTNQCRVLPANIQADDDLRQGIEQVLRRSRTLREQCARIGSAPHVHVRVTITPRITAPLTRAQSVVRRYASGLLFVAIELPVASTDFVELLAHEFEHVTEFIDGVDLGALARRGDTGVTRRRSDGAFESERAAAAGLAAAAEVQTDTSFHAAAVGRCVSIAVRAAWRGMRGGV